MVALGSRTLDIVHLLNIVQGRVHSYIVLSVRSEKLKLISFTTEHYLKCTHHQNQSAVEFIKVPCEIKPSIHLQAVSMATQSTMLQGFFFCLVCHCVFSPKRCQTRLGVPIYDILSGTATVAHVYCRFLLRSKQYRPWVSQAITLLECNWQCPLLCPPGLNLQTPFADFEKDIFASQNPNLFSAVAS